MVEKKASGSTDNPESAHEPNGREGRPSNIQPTNQGPNKVRKEIRKETPTATAKAKARANPNHDTDRIDNTGPELWEAQNLTALNYNLKKRGFRRHQKMGLT